MKRLIVELIICLILYALALLWVSKIPEGTPGLFGKQPEVMYSIDYVEMPIIEEIPTRLFDDPPISVEVNYATPTSAIEEPKKGLAQIEKRKHEPKKRLLGEYTLTAYIATGNPCADGVYPTTNHTIACNNPELWHKWVLIEGYGTYYCHDVGGMPSNQIIDLFVGSYDEAIQFGRRSAKVYLIE